MAEKTNYFVELNNINCNDKTEKKNGLTYLSWAWAWAEVKKRHPDATYAIYENKDGWCYHTDGKTCWVKTGVTIAGIEHIEYLPVMDYKNKSIPTDTVTSFDVNKAIQRSLTKACARHGVGLYIYSGEDLPEEEKTANIEAERKIAEEKTEIVNKIKKCCKDLIAAGYSRDDLYEKITKICGSRNFSGVEDVSKLEKLLKTVSDINNVKDVKGSVA